MLSIFPALLSLSLLGTFLLRIAVGAVFIFLGWRLARVARTHASKKKLYFGATIELSTGLFLFIGLFTQAAALLGASLALLHLVRNGTFKPVLREGKLLQVLLFMSSLSLLFLGSGAFAFDLPM